MWSCAKQSGQLSQPQQHWRWLLASYCCVVVLFFLPSVQATDTSSHFSVRFRSGILIQCSDYLFCRLTCLVWDYLCCLVLTGGSLTKLAYYSTVQHKVAKVRSFDHATKVHLIFPYFFKAAYMQGRKAFDFFLQCLLFRYYITFWRTLTCLLSTYRIDTVQLLLSLYINLL